MNKLFYSLALMLLFAFKKNYAQKTRTLYEHDILFGKVKEIFQISYMPGYRSAPAITDTIWYDENGKTTELHKKPRFGQLYIFEYLYSQDSSGRAMYVKYNVEDQIITSKLDDKGNLSEYNLYYKKNGKLNKKSFYNYDENDNLVLFTLKDYKNEIGLTRTFKYSQDNLKIEEQCH